MGMLTHNREHRFPPYENFGGRELGKELDGKGCLMSSLLKYPVKKFDGL